MAEKTYQAEYSGLSESVVTWSQWRNLALAIWGTSVFESGSRKIDVFWTDQEGGQTETTGLDHLQDAFERAEVVNISFGRIVPLSPDVAIRRCILRSKGGQVLDIDISMKRGRDPWI